MTPLFRNLRNLGAVFSLAVGLTGAGCTGSVEGAPTGMPPGGSGGAGVIPPGGSGGAGVTPPPSGAQPGAHLHKLTTSQFANSLRDLLGAGVPVAEVEPDAPEGFASVGASSIAISPSGVGQYEGAIAAATTWLFADQTRAAAALACVPQTATDAACLNQALTGFGKRAFRRPLTDVETQRLATLATTIAGQTGSSIQIGLRHALSGILQSPNFLYRVELGVPSPVDGGRLKYNSFEMASRLASALWNTVPDQKLLDAAGKEALATPDGVATEAKRMLTDARAQQGMAAFVHDLYVLRGLNDAAPDVGTFTAWTPTLRQAMQRELELRIEDLVFTSHGDFLSLLDGRTTFVNNELAKLYGLPTAAGDDFRRVDLPVDSPRAGLLGSGAILAGLALPTRTAPTRRGKFVREVLLCQTIPPPPQDVPPLPPTTDPNATMRERLAAHRVMPACASCHSLMDPLGFGMESFDAIGKYRTTENGRPVDASGELDGVTFNGLAQMGQVLRANAVAGPCFVSKLYMNALGRLAGEWDAATLNALATSFAASGNRADQLLVDLVKSEPFRFVEPTKP